MLHRYGSVAKNLALRLLALQPGDRFETVGQLAEQFGTGRGTVQSAMQLLVKEGCVDLESRGSLGSFVRTLDTAKLLAMAGISPIIGVMAVPYSLHFQGLAAGLTRAFERARLPLVLAHMRGGMQRLHFLRTGRCDFAVISRLSWLQEEPKGDLRQVFSFGPGSNVADHVLLLASPTAEGVADGMRVGVDPSSYDHVRLTREECQGAEVQLVEISYSQAVPKLLAGEIDAALWDAGVTMPAGLPLKVVPRRHRTPDADPNTEAVLVARTDASALAALIGARIHPHRVLEVQRRVLTGMEPPTF